MNLNLNLKEFLIKKKKELIYLNSKNNNKGKTSIITEIGIEYAKEGKYTLILTNKNKIKTKFPLKVLLNNNNNNNNENNNENNLSREGEEEERNRRNEINIKQTKEYYRFIQLSYNENKLELLKHLTTIQFYNNLPELLVIEDLSSIIDSQNNLQHNSIEFLEQVCFILGNLEDLINYCGNMTVIITDTCDTPEYINLIKQFMKRRIFLQDENENENNDENILNSQYQSKIQILEFNEEWSDSRIIGESILNNEIIEINQIFE